tara:strand:+ start:882 stop:3701 length:2820 start_codon:yes stop_codon:yes gene_type:complete
MKKWLGKRLALLGVLGVAFCVLQMTSVFGDSPPSSSFGSHATITVQNTSATTDFEGVLPIEMQPQNLIAGGFVNATMSDILFADQNATEVGGVGQNINLNGQPFFWYGEIPKQNSKQLKLYTFNATPATHKFPLGGLTTDDITVADSASLGIGNNLTLEAEVTLKETPTGTQEIFYKPNEYRLWLDSGVLKATLESNSITEVWNTQNLVPEPSPLYNHSSPVNNTTEGAIWGNYMQYCQAEGNDSAGWGSNYKVWEQNSGSGYTYDYTEQWIWPLNEELWALDGKVGIPTLPKLPPWSDVINGIDVAGVYNHGSPTVQQTNQGSGPPYYGEDLIEMINDPEGHSTLDNFVDLTLISWGANGVPDVAWDTTGHWPWGGQWVHGDELLHNLWNDSDQQSADWYNTYTPTYWSGGIKANGNTQYTGGGSYSNALALSTLWAGWDMPVDANNPSFDSNNLHRFTDYLSFDTTTGYPPSGGSNGIQPWWDRSRGVINHHGGNSSVWWGCQFNSWMSDFDETGLDNVKILGLKFHAISSFWGTTGQDYFNYQYYGDPQSTTAMFNNSPNPWTTGKYDSWSGQAMQQSFDKDYYHFGEQPTSTNVFVSFTHPTTDINHPKHGQTITVPDNYGWRNCYGYVGSSCSYYPTIEDVNHLALNLYWGSGYNSKVDPTAVWIEVRYFADQVVASTANVVSSATLQKDVTYDVKLTFEKPDIKLWVDGVEVGSSTLDGDITDTASALVLGESVKGWVDDFKISSGSISSPVVAMDLQFEPSHNTNTQVGIVGNSWVYTGTIADQSGNANTGTYNVTADTTDITTTVGGLVVADEPPPSGTDATIKDQIGAMPIGVFLTPQPVQASVLTAGLHDASTVGTMPQDAWWLLLATIIATVAGAKLMNYIPSLTIVAVAGGVVFAFIILFAGLTLWFLAFYTLWALGTISIQQYWKA